MPHASVPRGAPVTFLQVAPVNPAPGVAVHAEVDPEENVTLC